MINKTRSVFAFFALTLLLMIVRDLVLKVEINEACFRETETFVMKIVGMAKNHTEVCITVIIYEF